MAWCLGIIMIHGCQSDRGSGSQVSFNKHIRPILSDKCFACHGPDANKREADLRLDLEETSRKKLESGEGYAIVPGDLNNSLLFSRVHSEDPTYMMPPPESNLSLTKDEISLLEQWIIQGAKYEKHWAFIPPLKPPVPEGKYSWAINEIDVFILARLKEMDLFPNEEENPYLLLRRMKHDITGLPPTLEEQNSFAQADNMDKAYEILVDEALASQAYGEKMAILWMDIARYADSHGYQDDGLRTMWPWRDWVIHAFNQNYSYKKFIRWQLAGDQIPEKNKESLLATGFNRNHKITQEGGVIDEEYRIEYVTDRTNTFGKAFLGMTFECAKCHDHKYDPISQKEYYETFAFFNQVAEKGFYGDISIFSLADPPIMTISKDDITSILTFINKQDTGIVEVMVMEDDTIPRATHILNRGLYDQKGVVVDCGTPSEIFPFDSSLYGKDRAGLADWVFDDRNPLTARVFVNIVWQELFGRGLVATAGDFGLQGEYPSHPELLDWLAVDFRENGWDIKRLIKQMVMSNTYRQSQKVSEQKYEKDPENIYLSRGPRVRLSAELIRDHILATSGILYKEIGGPSVKPYQPSGLWEVASSGRGQLRVYEQDEGEDLYRRGLYTFIKRTVPPPSMLTFDASNRDQCEVSRQQTSTPLQALVLMNDPQVLEASRYLAQKLAIQTTTTRDKLAMAFQSIICRPPSNKELNIIAGYYEEVMTNLNPSRSKKLLSVGEIQEISDYHEETAGLMQSIQMLYNLEETSMR